MLTTKTQPLQHAKQVLLPTTIEAVRRQPYNRFGWTILDRWAYNSPKQLKELESLGEVVLLGRLLEQQELEQQALTSAEAIDSINQGSLAHEILLALEIKTEL
ncbi:hypothetical protein ACUDCK_29690 (plasmid) [Achromobacter sp. CF-sbj1-Ac2-l]|jgi:hypothetical protein|nr:hypothetical protein [Achromobacter xylosoxidans]CUJ64349.1 Uncharacterised protein [Achromobacter xylosoxidans]